MNRVKWFDKKFDFTLNQKEFKAVLIKLEETPDRISKLLQPVSEEILIKKLDNKWSIKENIGHLIDLEELHSGRIDDFIEGRAALRPADLNNIKTNEANHNEKEINSLLNVFKKVRKDFIKRLSELDENVLSKSLIHPRLNQPMRPIDMAQFVLEHDKHHFQTMEELVNKFQ